MDSQLSRHFRQVRLDKGVRVSHLARLCGYTNISKGSRRIHDFEHGGSIQRDLLLKMADALGIDRAKVEALVEEDRRAFFESWSAWASEPIEPYMVIRLIAAVYSEHTLPDEIESVEEAEAYAAAFAKEHRLQCCLVLSRRISVWFLVDGTISHVTEATPGQPNVPVMRIGGRKCVSKVVEHGIAISQVSWPKKQEVKGEPEVTEVVTEGDGIRFHSTVELDDDGVGQVNISVEVEEHIGWETTPDDLRTVLAAHNVSLPDDQVAELFAGLDCGAVEQAVLHYTDFDDQIRAMHQAIEDYLLERGVLKGPKQYEKPGG